MATGLTDVKLKALVNNPPAERLELKDGVVEGLTVRVGRRGKPTWTYRFRVRGAGGTTARGTQLNGARYHRISLGTYPTVSIKAARAKAGAYAEAAERGENPLDALEENAVDRRETVAALIDDYVDQARGDGMRSWRNARWVLDRHMRPKWEELPAGTVKERDALRLVADVRKGTEADEEQGKLRNGAAAELRKWGSMLFEWARRHGRVKVNPFRDVPAPKLSSRQRFLAMEEAHAVWRAAGELTYPWREAVRLLMLTGCRESEVCGARWPEFDSNKATLLIPPERYKSGRGFLVPLPADAKVIMESLPRFNAGDFMLTTTNGEKPIAGVHRKILDRLHRAAENVLERPMPRFALHDLRRTLRTHLPRLGVSEVVAELVLGHALKGLQARYNIYGYEAEKRDALQRWASELVRSDAHATGAPSRRDSAC
ncbi:MAG: tyrosine-type recombinase/integrase [Sphingomicrobium sp.]